MSIRLHGVVLCVFASLFTNSVLAQSGEIESLRVALDEMRADYETRISALEKRLAIAEQNANAGAYSPQTAPAVSVTRNTKRWCSLCVQPRDWRDISGASLELRE